jgi:hypothetical protein
MAAGPARRDRGQSLLTVRAPGCVGYGRGHDEGAVGLPVDQELVEHCFEVLDGRYVDLEQEAVLAGDAVALADLRGAFGQLGDLG